MKTIIPLQSDVQKEVKETWSKPEMCVLDASDETQGLLIRVNLDSLGDFLS